jgi:hypothetical protein
MSYQVPSPACDCQAINFIEVFSAALISNFLAGKTLLNREIW